MLFSALIFTFLTISANGQTSRMCYACASASLRDMWYITGLPQVTDSFFSESCDRVTGSTQEACSGPCVTITFDDPNTYSASNLASSSIFTVRGCHQTLTQTITDRSLPSTIDGTKPGDFCEYDDKYQMATAGGKLQNVRMMVRFCSDSGCNSQTVLGNTFGGENCKNQTNDNTLNNSPLNCYDCNPEEGSNCHTSRCTKKYCMKQQVNMDGGYQVIKTCSNVNIFGIDNTCETFDVFTNPGGVPVKSQYTQCYCKDKQFCNVSANFSPILAIILAFIIKF